MAAHSIKAESRSAVATHMRLEPHALGSFIRAAIVVALIALAWRSGDGVLAVLHESAAAEADAAFYVGIATVLLVYVALMALPYCPGIEIGLALIAVVGREIIPFVYAATVAALVLAFVFGRFVPPHRVIETLGSLGLARARELLPRIERLDAGERLHLWLNGRSAPLLRALLRHRYVVLAIALNTPGNWVIGDGGGIALAAGFSRLFSLPGFALTVALAVAPVPLAIALAPS